MTYYINIITDIIIQTSQEILSILDAKESSLLTTIIVNCIIIMLMGAGVTPFVCYTAQHTTTNLQVYSHVMEKKTLELRKEKRKSEKIINQMLPKSVSNR